MASTRFIYENSYVQMPVQRGEYLDIIVIPKLKQHFNIHPSYQLVVCKDQMGETSITGVLLRSPFHTPLTEAYCYKVKQDEYHTLFQKLSIIDQGDPDTPELQFLVYKHNTLKELERMFQYIKDTKLKSFRFQDENTNSPLPLTTDIFSLPPETKLKIFPNVVRVLLHYNGQEIDKAKIPVSMFRRFNAKSLLLRIFEQHKDKVGDSRVCFEYRGVEIPENQVLQPEAADEAVILVRTVRSPVVVTVVDELSRNAIIKKVVESEGIYYRTPFEIAHLLSIDVKFYSDFRFAGVYEGEEYYKEGSEIAIVAENQQGYQIETIMALPVQKGDKNFEIFKSEMRKIFKKNQEESRQNQETLDLITLYNRLLFDQ